MPFVGAALAAAACSQNADKSCTLLGCQSSAHVVATAKATMDQMRTATVTACRNNACAKGTPAVVPTVPGDPEEMTLAGSVNVEAHLSVVAGGGSYTVTVDFPIDDNTSAVNGDTYDLHVTDQGGAALGGVTGTANYTTTTPNGAGCPPVCKNATIM